MSKQGAVVLREYYCAPKSHFISYYDSVPLNKETYDLMRQKFPGHEIVEKHSMYKGHRYHDFIIVLPMEVTKSW